MSAPLISVVVCTFRRPRLLMRFLPSVCVQRASEAGFEVIVVDNNSRDGTRDSVAALARRYPGLRYEVEPRQGVAHARNRGWRKARGRYVAYLDDDCRVPPEWLAVARGVIERHAPVEFGGPIYGFFEGEPPGWWRRSYEADHSHAYAPAACYLAPHQEIYGGNLFLQRTAIERVGGFDPRLGMRGRRLAYGEEWDLHRRLTLSIPNHRAYYQPRLYVEHLVRAEKMSLSWRLREQLSRGRDTHLIACRGRPLYSRAEAVALALRAAAESIRSGLFAGLVRDRNRYPKWQNYIYENNTLNILLHKLGQLLAQRSAAPRWRRSGAPRPACGCRLETTLAGRAGPP